MKFKTFPIVTRLIVHTLQDVNRVCDDNISYFIPTIEADQAARCEIHVFAGCKHLYISSQILNIIIMHLMIQITCKTCNMNMEYFCLATQANYKLSWETKTMSWILSMHIHYFTDKTSRDRQTCWLAQLIDWVSRKICLSWEDRGWILTCWTTSYLILVMKDPGRMGVSV